MGAEIPNQVWNDAVGVTDIPHYKLATALIVIVLLYAQAVVFMPAFAAK
jgi:hypothetical protein